MSAPLRRPEPWDFALPSSPRCLSLLAVPMPNRRVYTTPENSIPKVMSTFRSPRFSGGARAKEWLPIHPSSPYTHTALDLTLSIIDAPCLFSGYMEAQMANDKSATTFTRNVLSKAVKSTAAYYVEEDLNTWVAAKNLDTETLAPKDGASENKLTEKNVLSTSYVNADKNDPLKKVYTDQIKAITSSADGKTVTIYLLKTMGTLKATDFTLEDESGKTGPKVSKVAADSKDKKKLTWILALASAMVDSKSYALLYMKTDTGMSVRYTAPPKLSTTTALAVPPLQTTPAPTTTRTPTSSLTTTKSKTTLTTTVIKTSTKVRREEREDRGPYWHDAI